MEALMDQDDALLAGVMRRILGTRDIYHSSTKYEDGSATTTIDGTIEVSPEEFEAIAKIEVDWWVKQ